jgi:hypothetical protein
MNGHFERTPEPWVPPTSTEHEQRTRGALLSSEKVAA